MINAELNSDKGVATMKLTGTFVDLFVDACMFCSALYTRLREMNIDSANAFLKALSEYCSDMAEGNIETTGKIKESVSIDHRIIDILNKFKNDT